MIDTTIFHSKRGQVTIFIILGILLVLALVLIIFLRKEVITVNPDKIIPTEKGKIESLISSCVEKVGNEALFLIGTQGGYTTVPPEILQDRGASLQVAPDHAIPLWASGPDTYIPSLEDIKGRIDEYIQENLQNCALNNTDLANYDIEEKSEIESNTEIVENKVLFNVHWMLDIRSKAGDIIAQLSDHSAESNVQLKKIHQLATRIVEKEMQDLKLEDITQDLIALESVPVAGMELGCSKKTWEVAKVKQTLLELVRFNIAKLQIKGTNQLQFSSDLPYYQNHYIWDLGEQVNYPTLNAAFSFEPSYPYIFAVSPSSGNLMTSSQLGGSDALSFLCIQNWKFNYDLIYPVKVRIRDESSGYNFNLAFTVHVLHNLPNRDKALFKPQIQLNKPTDADFCNARRIPMTIRTLEYVENGQGVDYSDDIEGVNISFSCLNFKCLIGASEFDVQSRGFSGLVTDVPYCSGAIVRGVKEGYKEAWVRTPTAVNKEVTLQLIPIIKIPVNRFKVFTHEFKDANHIGEAQESKGNDNVIIELSYFKENSSELLHKTQAVKVSEEELNVQTYFEFLAKADFRYTIDVRILRNDQLLGGYVGNWTATWDQLEQAQDIKIHTIVRENANEDQMANLILNLAEESKLIAEPEIS